MDFSRLKAITAHPSNNSPPLFLGLRVSPLSGQPKGLISNLSRIRGKLFIGRPIVPLDQWGSIKARAAKVDCKETIAAQSFTRRAVFGACAEICRRQGGRGPGAQRSYVLLISLVFWSPLPCSSSLNPRAIERLAILPIFLLVIRGLNPRERSESGPQDFYTEHLQ